MPGLISHFLCGAAAEEGSEERISEEIAKHRRIFNIGTQGPDVFFYYLPNLFKKKPNIGSIMHRQMTGKFIENMLIYSATLTEEERAKAFAYIAGYLTHYSLDCHAHPYIYYKTGTAKKDKASRLRHSMYHRQLETAIDTSLLLFLKKERVSEKRLYKIIKTERAEAEFIGRLLTYAIDKTYNITLDKNEAEKSIKYMWQTTKILHSRISKHKKLIAAMENRVVGSSLVASLIHNDMDNSSREDYLNLRKGKWYLPWNSNEEKNDSFTDLFFSAVNESTQLIALLFDYFTDKGSYEPLLEAVGSRSFISGVDESHCPEFLYFERSNIKS